MVDLSRFGDFWPFHRHLLAYKWRRDDLSNALLDKKKKKSNSSLISSSLSPELTLPGRERLKENQSPSTPATASLFLFSAPPWQQRSLTIFRVTVRLSDSGGKSCDASANRQRQMAALLLDLSLSITDDEWPPRPCASIRCAPSILLPPPTSPTLQVFFFFFKCPPTAGAHSTTDVT